VSLYLDGVPHLPADLLAQVDRQGLPRDSRKRIEDELDAHLFRIKQLIRQRRERWERRNQCVIEPEPPEIPLG